ncbi:hypothetical protein [uncultured Shewanella sp.]|uniref:hypothetical protein n=1 Tax=uncultured Shewanella sp. TaxID=173975 RepID=UPI0026382A7E|nr:hypothetical protein [uncultured Shewanella sp.]
MRFIEENGLDEEYGETVLLSFDCIDDSGFIKRMYGSLGWAPSFSLNDRLIGVIAD